MKSDHGAFLIRANLKAIDARWTFCNNLNSTEWLSKPGETFFSQTNSVLVYNLITDRLRSGEDVALLFPHLYKKVSDFTEAEW